MREKLYKTIIILLAVSVSAHAQNKVATLDGKQVTLLDNSYSYRDTIEKLFLKMNGRENWNLRQRVNSLSFDHCRHGEVEMLMYCDTTGAAIEVQLMIGTALSKIDSLIVALTKSFSKQFKPVQYNGKYVRSLILIKYQFHDKWTEEKLAMVNGQTGVSLIIDRSFEGQMNLITDPNGRTRKNNCEDDSYFYNEGVKYYQQDDFKRAIYNFNQALGSNEYDFDALYNLGLSYQKADKLKKACECFKNGAAASDTNSANAFNKYCLEANKK